MVSEAEAGMALSMQYVDRNWGGFLNLPSEIGGSRDVYLKSRSQNRRAPEQINSMYTQVKKFILEFDEKTKGYFKEFKEMELEEENFDIENVVEKAREGHKESRELLTKVNKEELILNNPSIYFTAYKHYKLSSIYLKMMEDITEEVDLEEVVGKIDYDKKIEEFRLGIFLALEPILINSIVIADDRGDNQFINTYEELLDRFAFQFTRTFREKFEQETGFQKIRMEKEDVDQLAEREGFEERTPV